MNVVVQMPDRTERQRLESLQKANEHRSLRARLKRDIKAGRVDVSSVIASPPEWAHTMKVMALLLAQPKWGRVKTEKLLNRQDVSPSKTLSGLSPRQRAALLAELDPSETVARAPRTVWRAPVRDRVLTCVVTLGGAVRADDVSDHTDVDVVQARRCLRDLCRRGLLVRVGYGAYSLNKPDLVAA